MVANNEGQQAPIFGDPNDPSSSHSAVPRYVPLTVPDMPGRPESSASDQSSSSGFASQISYDGGVTLPPTSVASSSSHDHSQQQAAVNHTGATNAQVQAPRPVRIIRNISINGAAHAHPADLFTGDLNAYSVGPEVSTSQSASQAYVNGNNIVHGTAHANSAGVFSGGLNAYRVGPDVSTSQPASQAYANGNGTGSVNIAKNDRIYGNMNDNRLSSLYRPRNGHGNGNVNRRSYGNGITRRGRDNRIQGSPQTFTGGFGNSNAFAPDGSRFPLSNHNAPQQQPVNRMLFQEPPNHRVLTFRAQIPHQTQFPTPLTMFSAPPDPFDAPGRTRSAALANFIRSGAMDDGQSLDPDARTPNTGSDRRQRRRTNSVQFYTPTRSRGSHGSRRNRYGDTPSSSEQSSTMNTPSRNMRSAGSYGTPTTHTPASNILHGQTWPPPGWMNEVCTKQPTLNEALTSLPFSNPYEKVSARGNGVVKFTNIPYTTLRSELIAALGRSARPINMPQGSPFYAVHIIMDRNTGKTGAGYVELNTTRDSLDTVRAINRRATDGSRALKIGDREVTVQVSNSEELMAALFPHAGAVEWTGYTPRVIDVDTLFYPGKRGTGFTGFCGSEELAMLVKFAESQSRSPFVQRTPYRLYECIISTLHRLPWHTPRYITLAQRKKLYDAVRCCMEALIVALDRDENDRQTGISDILLQEFATAALSCVGFSEQQKASLVEELAAHGHLGFGIGRGMNVHLGGSGMFSASWPFLALTPTPFVNSELLKFYISLISKASEVKKNTSLYDMAGHLELDTKPFGRFAIDYNSVDMVNLSLEDIARSEIDAVARVLASVLLGGCSGPLYELE